MIMCVYMYDSVCLPAPLPCLPVSQSKPASMVLYEGQYEE